MSGSRFLQSIPDNRLFWALQWIQTGFFVVSLFNDPAFSNALLGRSGIWLGE
jgi:hypothetical protein